MLSEIVIGSLVPLGILADADGVLAWLTSAWNLLAVVLGFSLVVFVHELGHFLAAKWAGVRVEKFCIGFGKELFGFTRGETRYGFNILPLGGYVKMLGQEDFAVDKAGELKVKDQEGSFMSKSVGQRMVIVSAGVIMNLIFAAAGLTLYMMMGYQSLPAVIGYVAPGTPASRAGLMTGDKIVAVNGDPIKEFPELNMKVALSDSGEELEFDVERNGKRVVPNPRLLPEFNEREQLRQMGVGTGWNRIVWMSTGLFSEFSESELQPNDRLDAVVRDGQREPVKNVADVIRALMTARGKPVDLIVTRPTGPVPLDQRRVPDDESWTGREAAVQANALWYLQPETPQKSSEASLLGLVPRIRVEEPMAGLPADVAGVRGNDVVVSWGGSAYPPNQREFYELVERDGGWDIPVVVRRPGQEKPSAIDPKKPELSAAAVEYIARNREIWLDVAARDPEGAREMALDMLPSAGLDAMELTSLSRRIEKLATPQAWLEWLEGIDQRVLTIRPERPFSLWGRGKPQIGLPIQRTEDDRLVVADVFKEIDGRPTPASKAGIPRGATIVSVEGQFLRTWAELTEALRAHAGKPVAMRYRVGLEYHETMFDVPDSISTQCSLPQGAYIQEIAGKTSVQAGDRTFYLPDWRAVREILRANVGKGPVTVKYLTLANEPAEATFSPREDNLDPWLMRVGYLPSFFCYDMRIHRQETNPWRAFVAGVEKTYYATWSTIQSIRHMVFTRQVGVDKVSGPVGIARLGMKVASLGWKDLLQFMCFISANLAVINFLPLPIVDGGLFLFLLLEKIRGEPVSLKVQTATQLIGIILIASIFLFVTFQDVKNWNR